MKKLFFFAAALMMGTSMFASLEQEPSNEALQAYAEAGQNLVYAIYVEDSIMCGDIVLWGTYNSWSQNASECSTFVAVDGYAGWYVCCVADATDPDQGAGIQAKPVHLDGAGAFNEDYQVGALTDDERVRGTATIEPGYNNDCNIKAISDAQPLLINVTCWKTNPCFASGLDDVMNAETAKVTNKAIVNGRMVIILEDGRKYNVLGAEEE